MTVIHWQNHKKLLAQEQQKAACKRCDQKVGRLKPSQGDTFRRL